MPDIILDLLNNTAFWIGSTVVLLMRGILEKAFLYVFTKIRMFFQTKKDIITFSVKCVDPSLGKSVRFGYLLIRFGTDEVLIKGTLTNKEKRDAFLQNKEVYAKSDYDENKKEINVSITLKVHKILGAQFKCFVDALDCEQLDKLRSLIEGDEKFGKVGLSGLTNKHRLYFLLNDRPLTKTPEGSVNNFIYPV